MTNISENTQVTLDLKTISIIVVGAISIASVYFTLQSDIDLAKELPKPTINRTEYDLKDQLVRETIININEKALKKPKPRLLPSDDQCNLIHLYSFSCQCLANQNVTLFPPPHTSTTCSISPHSNHSLDTATNGCHGRHDC